MSEELAGGCSEDQGPAPTVRVAVVGAGPSGIYCAQLLVERAAGPIEVDVFDRLPAPFGLVRYGVAPDHPRIASIGDSLGEAFENSAVRFLGNIEIGRDLTVEELRASYDAVVLATGAPNDRRLGIPGEDLVGAHPVGEFVSWYQGHPDAAVNDFGLESARRAVIIGMGNVALDAARMLLLPPEFLSTTNVPDRVLDGFQAGDVREVTIVGRRGPAHAKFTNKELLQLFESETWDLLIDPAELVLSEEEQVFVDTTPTAARLMKTFEKIAERGALGRPKSIRFLFRCTPKEMIGNGRVEAVVFETAGPQVERPALAADLVLSSVGFRGEPLDGVPFDHAAGTIPSVDSRVNGMGRVYVTGWIKRGPSGVVGSNRVCAMETAASVLSDREMMGDRATESPRADRRAEIDALLMSRGVRTVEWMEWQAIDRVERLAGTARGSVRVKMQERGAMLAAADRGGDGSGAEKVASE